MNIRIIIALVAALMLAACGGGGGSSSSGGDGGGTTNTAPIANAGAAQSVSVGAVVTLDGRSSSDADGDTLAYAWTLTNQPGGSSATLSGATTARPTFTPDVEGTYTASLVVNDGTVNSAADTVSITATAPSTEPVADAGPNQSVIVPTIVTLDGSGSTAAAGATLSYAWTLSSRPAGSAATLSDPTSARPNFSVDVAGVYTASLVVSDGTSSSDPSTVTITGSTANAPPVADAGRDQNVTIPATVNLDGTGSSDPNGDALAYTWSFASRPAGSAATLAGATTATPNFAPDVAGTYRVQLVVNDGQVNSAPSTVEITAATDNSAPIADAGPAQQVAVGDTVSLDGSASSDADRDALTYSWTLTTQPAGSTATLADPTAVSTTFNVDVAGIYVASLVVSDGTLDSAPDSVSVTAYVDTAIGEAVQARNGLLVTLDAFEVQDLNNGFTQYSATYTQENNTAEAIPEGSLRLYFTNGSPVKQFLFPGEIAPGGSLTFTYAFEVESSLDPFLLQYDGDQADADEPIFEAVHWVFPIQ